MLTLLLGGFGPFGDYQENPSSIIAETLADQFYKLPPAAGWDVKQALFEADLRYFRFQLSAVLEKHQPSAVLLLGLNAQIPCLNLENFALNVGRELSAPTKHELNKTFSLDPRDKAGTDIVARQTDIDTVTLTERLRRLGIPARPSFHAGTFACNAVYFDALGWATARDPVPPTIFVHLPLLSDQAARHASRTGTFLASLSLVDVCTGLTEVVSWLVNLAESHKRSKAQRADPSGKDDQGC